MPDWFEEALALVVEKIEAQGEVDGFAFLQDYFLDNEDQLIDEYEQFSAEDFAEYFLDRFQKWLFENNSNITISLTGRWIIDSDIRKNEESAIPDEHSLTDSEHSLLSIQLHDIDEESFDNLRALVSKLEGNGDSRVVSCSIKLARSAEKIGKRDSEMVSYWKKAVEYSGAFNDNDNSVLGLKELAYYYVKMSRYEKAAELYRKAVNLTDDVEVKVSLLREARIQFQNCGDHESASKAFILKMDTRKKKEIYLNLLSLTSRYGESPKVVCWNIVFWIVSLTITVTPFIDTCFNRSEKSDYVIVDAFYYVMITFTTLGYGDITPGVDGWKIVSGFISFLGLIYTSLLMVTIVRKYSRS